MAGCEGAGVDCREGWSVSLLGKLVLLLVEVRLWTRLSRSSSKLWASWAALLEDESADLRGGLAPRLSRSASSSSTSFLLFLTDMAGGRRGEEKAAKDDPSCAEHGNERGAVTAWRTRRVVRRLSCEAI